MSTKATTAGSMIMVVAVAVALLAVAWEAEAQTCDWTPLKACEDTIITNTTPKPKCCTAVKAQNMTCLCQFFKNPAFGPFVNTPGAKKVLTACNVTLTC